MKKGTLALSSIQRRVTMLSLNEPVLVEAYVPTSSIIYLDTLKLDVDFLSKGIFSAPRRTHTTVSPACLPIWT